jgi:uncharacterized membrane protein YuzA (DUF378 family)
MAIASENWTGEHMGILPPSIPMKMYGKNMCTVCFLVSALVIIGALNWGLVGLGWLLGGANWNVVNLLLGQWTMVEAIVYVLVGLAALWQLFMYPKCCGKVCANCANPQHKGV